MAAFFELPFNRLKMEQNESFAELLDASLKTQTSFEGKVAKGIVVAIRGDTIIIDVGLKSEGRVPLKEAPEARVGDALDVYIERLEDRHGEVILSVEKARREFVWETLQKACDESTFVDGVIFGKVKGGFAVDLSGVMAFLPGSQVDLRPIKDVRPLVGVSQPFLILKMDKVRNNIVVSRRSVLEQSRAEAKTELMSRLTENQIIQGVVKNITDYGAFVDLGGVDGLLHVTDISWKRVNHPSEVLKVGDSVEVQVIRFNKDTGRISLGMKQLGPDPWAEVAQRFIVGERYHGTVVNLADYGAFIELAPGIEGLIYVTEMSWTRKNVNPNKVLTVGQEVEIVVLEIDIEKRRISLGLKQCFENPWQQFKENYPVGSLVKGIVRNVTEFGIFIGVNEDLDGMVHLNDISWEQNSAEDISATYQKGQEIQVKVLDVDPQKERISLGIKQLVSDPFEGAASNLSKGDTVKGTISSIEDREIHLALENGLVGTIKKTDLSRDRETQRIDRFEIGETVEAKVIAIDKSSRKVSLSIKALEIEEGRAALSELGGDSSDGNSTLGALLEEAMKKKGN